MRAVVRHAERPRPARRLMSRVLYLMPNAVPGGAERATMVMLGAHDRRRYEPGVLFFSDGPLVADASALGLRTHVLSRPMRLRNPLAVGAAVLEVARLVRRHGYALLHSCMSYAHLVGGPASPAARQRIAHRPAAARCRRRQSRRPGRSRRLRAAGRACLRARPPGAPARRTAGRISAPLARSVPRGIVAIGCAAGGAQRRS